MKLQKSILLIALLPLLLAGCAGKTVDRDRLAGQIDVFDIELFSAVDYRNINGIVATEEPCLKGYERNFEALDIIVGYGFDHRIRKISTFNPGTSLFGISPGMPFDAGREKILQSGFNEEVPPHLFGTNGYTLKFLVGSDHRIFGLTLETLD